MSDGNANLARQLRQRLELLALAGIDRLPLPLIAAKAQSPSAVPATSPARPVPQPRLEPAEKPAIQARPSPPASPSPVTNTPEARPLALASSLFGDETFDEPALPPEARPSALEELAKQVAPCVLCANLASSRTQTVFGEGKPNARLMFIGEAPGADEDATGRPFIGKAGQLLTDMITKGMGLKREDVYIANILKCRPPGNRDPMPDEVGRCLPYLERQIAIVRPEYLCLLGRISASILLKTALPAGKLRGRWQRYRGIPTIVTWHPAFLLRSPAHKKDTWADLQMLMQAMGLKAPKR
ncbi:MAG: uracil-DNA glycosylase [Isosphaeraceae bacterium]